MLHCKHPSSPPDTERVVEFHLGNEVDAAPPEMNSCFIQCTWTLK